MLSGPGDNKSRAGRPNSFYALLVDTEGKKVVRLEPPPKIGEAYKTEDTPEGYKRFYPVGNSATLLGSGLSCSVIGSTADTTQAHMAPS